MKNLFEHFETLNRQERESIATELANMYNELLRSEREYFARGRTAANRHAYHDINLAYMSVSGSLGTLQGVFNLLGIPFEYGQMIEI